MEITTVGGEPVWKGEVDRDDVAPVEHYVDMTLPADASEALGFVTKDQVGCARCDAAGHPGIVYRPLTFQLMLADGWAATHWAPCPTNGEPILFCQRED